MNERPYCSLIIGYIEGITDCIMSLSKWAKLIAIRIGKIVASFLMYAESIGLSLIGGAKLQRIGKEK